MPTFTRIVGDRGCYPRNCRRFLTLGASRNFKSINSRRDPRGRRRDPRNCRAFGPSEPLGAAKCQHSQGSWGSGSRSSHLSSLFDPWSLSEFEKCQHRHKDSGVAVTILVIMVAVVSGASDSLGV